MNSFHCVRVRRSNASLFFVRHIVCAAMEVDQGSDQTDLLDLLADDNAEDSSEGDLFGEGEDAEEEENSDDSMSGEKEEVKSEAPSTPAKEGLRIMCYTTLVCRCDCICCICACFPVCVFVLVFPYLCVFPFSS